MYDKNLEGQLSGKTTLANLHSSLLDLIRTGGPLAKLFHKAVAQQQQSSQDVLKNGPRQEILQQLAIQTRRQVKQGTDSSQLVVLRQCEAGCNACCHTSMVDVTTLEALLVAQYLQQNMTASELEPIKDRLRINADRRRNMTVPERDQKRLPCALLGEDGLCQVYEARPIICEGVFSLSRQACQDAVAGPDSMNQNIPLDQPAKAWAMGISGGLQRALVEEGLDGNLYELNSAVFCALEQKDGAERWLRGEDLFKDCYCTDAHSPPRKLNPHLRIDPPEKPNQRSSKRRKTLQKKRALKRRKARSSVGVNKRDRT